VSTANPPRPRHRDPRFWTRAVAVAIAVGTMLVALIGVGGPAAGAEPTPNRTVSSTAGNGGLAH
jgi:hypothetical protein